MQQANKGVKRKADEAADGETPNKKDNKYNNFVKAGQNFNNSNNGGRNVSISFIAIVSQHMDVS